MIRKEAARRQFDIAEATARRILEREGKPYIPATYDEKMEAFFLLAVPGPNEDTEDEENW